MLPSFVPEDMAVVLATASGVPTGLQWLPHQYKTLTWSREAAQVSKCEVVVPAAGQKVYPWLHWISVWDMTANTMLWRGPVVYRSRGKDLLSISARDVAVFSHKTRTPLTKRWDAQYPAVIAAELFRPMLDLQGLDIVPRILDDPYGDPFDYSTKRDEKMLNITLDDLVKLGLQWTVVAGTPVLGPMPRTPAAALTDQHFLDHDLQLVMDGSLVCNDIVLRGPDAIGRGREPMPAGLVLQGIANIDDIFGVSNVDKAVTQYLRHHSKLRESLTGGQVKLRLDAPLRLTQLVPSARVTVNLYDVTTPMALDSLQVNADEGGVSASVSLAPVNDDPPELDSKVEAGAL